MRSRLRAKALAGFGTCFFCVERSPFAVWRLKRQRPLCDRGLSSDDARNEVRWREQRMFPVAPPAGSKGAIKHG